MKRASWLESVAGTLGGDPAIPAGARDELRNLDDALFEAWNLGENIILSWTQDATARRFLFIRHYNVLEPFGPASDVVLATTGTDFVNGLLSREKFATPREFDSLCERFGAAAHVVSVPLPTGSAVPVELVSGLLRRYSVTLVRERAVLLLDAVGFALHSPLEQVAMLNSLSYSVNSAYRQLVSEDVQINFARSSTGDGFYIWNRARTVDANVALYKLLLLILADNAVARTKARRFPVPQLRAAFHVGEHYEFYQVEALNPTTFSYIVGHVTIELARILEKARPGQILLGDFAIASGDPRSGELQSYGTLDFISRTEALLQQLEGLEVANDHIARIRCYLTGRSTPQGAFEATRYTVTDKHGFTRPVYNAKINIHLAAGEPIFLGLQHRDLHAGEPAVTA
ncbi:MAG TPA: hypothetical protein VF851_07055 [Steroidobacteraceae bacterium]